MYTTCQLKKDLTFLAALIVAYAGVMIWSLL